MKNEVPSRESSQIPELIYTPYPFVAVGDLSRVTSKINVQFKDDQKIGHFQRSLIDLQLQYAPEGSTFYYIDQDDLFAGIEKKVNARLDLDRCGVVNFDRYLFAGRDLPNSVRLELSRGSNNRLISRPGCQITPEQQMTMLLNWINVNSYSELLLIDDVIAFATTFTPIIARIRKLKPDVQISAISGICSSGGSWSGKEKLEELGVKVDSVTVVKASPALEGSSSGMAIPDSRDSTIFGGKIGITDEGRALSFPYFYPFSTPTTSLMKANSRIEASEKWLGFNIELVQYLNQVTGRSLLIQDLENAQFGAPSCEDCSFEDQLPTPDGHKDLVEYLWHARDLLMKIE